MQNELKVTEAKKVEEVKALEILKSQLLQVFSFAFIYILTIITQIQIEKAKIQEELDLHSTTVQQSQVAQPTEASTESVAVREVEVDTKLEAHQISNDPKAESENNISEQQRLKQEFEEAQFLKALADREAKEKAELEAKQTAAKEAEEKNSAVKQRRKDEDDEALFLKALAEREAKEKMEREAKERTERQSDETVLFNFNRYFLLKLTFLVWTNLL